MNLPHEELTPAEFETFLDEQEAKPQAKTIDEIRDKLCLKLGYDDGLKGRQDVLVTEETIEKIINIMVKPTQALITEAKADERQAMLDLPELQDENVYPTPKGMAIAIIRNELRADIRAAIKLNGGSDE